MEPTSRSASPRRTLLAALVALLVGSSVFLLLSPDARAGQTPPTTCSPDDPYGCVSTTTTVAPNALPECLVSDSEVEVGQTLLVTITNVPTDLEVSLLLNGQVVDTAVSGAVAAAAVAGDGAEVANHGGPLHDVVFNFRVPNLPAGRYTLQAVGPAFICECLPGEGLRILGTDVSPTTISRTPPKSSGGGSLARTGITVLGLVILAVLLLVAGRWFVERSRRHAA